jgi:hypothetical protein
MWLARITSAEQRGRGLGRFLLGRMFIHAAVGEGLLQLGTGERGVELVDDRTQRAGGREQH